MLENPHLISDLIAAQVGSRKASNEVHNSVPNPSSDPPFTPLCPDECFIVPKTPTETLSVQPRGSDTQRNGLSFKNSSTENTVTETPTAIPSPTKPVTVDTSSIRSNTKAEGASDDVQQSSTCPSQSNTTLSSPKLDFPTLEMPTTVPSNGFLRSEISRTSSDVSESCKPFPITPELHSSPEFLLKTNLNPEVSCIENTSDNCLIKPSVFDNASLTSPQDRFSSSTVPSEGTTSSASCYMSSL